jgi:hypothetical protein
MSSRHGEKLTAQLSVSGDEHALRAKQRLPAGLGLQDRSADADRFGVGQQSRHVSEDLCGSFPPPLALQPLLVSLQPMLVTGLLTPCEPLAAEDGERTDDGRCHVWPVQSQGQLEQAHPIHDAPQGRVVGEA